MKHSAPQKSAADRKPRISAWVAVVFGIVTPALAVAVEATNGMWGDSFFDPIPTPLHGAAILLVPLTITLFLVAARRDVEAPGLVRGPLWGAAIGVAGWYALIFTPFIPLSLGALILYGAGLLPLSPITSFVVLVKARPEKGRRRGALWGALAALGLLSLADLPQVMSHVLLARAGSRDVSVATPALRTLRENVPDSTILAAVSRPMSMMSPVGAVVRLGWERQSAQARVTAWRATGQVPPPQWRGFLGWQGNRREFATEAQELGGEVVGSRVADLCMSSSRLSADVDAQAGIADIWWEMRFRNDSAWEPDEAEARGLVQLPPGAVVADASLWVDGTERRAVITSRGKAQEAYRQVVVVERRDPLLVTTSGPDQVQVQCFPVPGKGGTMRIALRIAARVLPTPHGPRLELPYFVERNFALCDGGEHEQEIRGLDDNVPTAVALDAARLDVPSALAEGLPVESRPSWSVDPFDAERELATTHVAHTVIPPAGIVLVVDASGATAEAKDAVAAALAAIPDGTPTMVIGASDHVVDATPGLVPLDDATRASVVAALDALPWMGGIDAVDALARASTHAQPHPGARILWLHGPQAMRSRDVGAELLPEMNGGRFVHALRIAAGVNRVATDLRGRSALSEPWAPGDTPAARADALLTTWFGTSPAPRLHIGSVRAGAQVVERVPCTLPHALAALWAHQEVASLRMPVGHATALASQYRIVTPLTGAVVLETDEDYERAGLSADGRGAPSVPEPAEWAIVVLVAGALLVAWKRRAWKRRLRSAVA